MKKPISKIIAITLMLVFNYAGLSAVGTTLASFSDTETSGGNTFTAGTLDISFDNAGAYSSGLMYPGDATTTAISLSYIGSVNSQYTASTTLSGTDTTACEYITMTVATTTAVSYTGLIKNFISATSTTVDMTWNFTFTVAGDAPTSVWGKTCSFTWAYTAWQENMPDSSLGFTAIQEKLGAIKIGSGVVLNEFLPNPTGSDSADIPNGEWVELYNNSSVAKDISGWYVSDSSDGTGHKIFINTEHTGLETQIIGAKSWLVVYMNKEFLNNKIDVVRLFDNNGNLVDTYSYCGPLTSGGNCGSIPENKSFARIPDGIGEWVDPIPTPGTSNEIGNEVVGEEENKSETVITPEVTEEAIAESEVLPIPDETALAEIPEEEVITETEPAIEPEVIAEVVETVITAEPNIEPEAIEEAIVEAVPDDGLVWMDAAEETPAVVAEPEVLPVSEEVIE